ncbi:hypothetical protein BLX05_13290 [Bacillus pseudomycoides]|nr:hypothetical protein BLX05_13290 [Bacillus pseudomycoides]
MKGEIGLHVCSACISSSANSFINTCIYLTSFLKSIFRTHQWKYHSTDGTFIFPRYSQAVRPPPQVSERSKKDRRGITARKSPIGEAPTDGSFTL